MYKFQHFDWMEEECSTKKKSTIFDALSHSLLVRLIVLNSLVKLINFGPTVLS